VEPQVILEMAGTLWKRYTSFEISISWTIYPYLKKGYSYVDKELIIQADAKMVSSPLELTLCSNNILNREIIFFDS
jgi:hypothetical protein